MLAYNYKITLRAPHNRSMVAHGRGQVKVKHSEPDTAIVTTFLYGQRNIEQAKASLLAELPQIRKRAGVQLTAKDIENGFSSKMFTFDRIAH
jgi:hypothetical protein